MIGFHQLRLGTTVLILALCTFVLSRIAGGVVDLDLFHEMALAREAVSTGAVPWKDSFAYTPTLNVVVHHEWGLGLIGLLLSNVGGGSGIILLKFLLVYSLGFVVWSTARRRRIPETKLLDNSNSNPAPGAKPVIVALFMTLGIVLSDFGFATVRAQMFSYLFAALLLWGFDRDREGNRWWLAGVALLFPLWANLHGGCLVGAALFATHWLEQLIRRQPHWHLFAMGLLLIPLAALNPWGFHFHYYLIHAISLPRPAIAEWSPLWDAANRQQLINFVVSLLPLLVVLRQIGWRGIPGLLIILATAFAALKSNRFLPFYAIAYASYLPAAFCRTTLGKDLRQGWIRFQAGLATALSLVSVVLLIGALPAEPWRLQVASHPLPHQGHHLIYPVGAVDYLTDQQFRGNVMVPYDWGSYVMWKLGPDVKVSIDSRYEVAYPLERMTEDDCFFHAETGWKEILAKYETDIVLTRADLPIVKAIEGYPGWSKIYSDAQFQMFARSGLDLPLRSIAGSAPNGTFP